MTVNKKRRGSFTISLGGLSREDAFLHAVQIINKSGVSMDKIHEELDSKPNSTRVVSFPGILTYEEVSKAIKERQKKSTPEKNRLRADRKYLSRSNDDLIHDRGKTWVVRAPSKHNTAIKRFVQLKESHGEFSFTFVEDV